MKNASMKVFIRHTQSELPWLRPGGLDAFPRPKWTDGARPVRTESLRYIMSKKKERKKEKHPSQAKRRNQKPQAWSVEIQKPFSPLGFVANEYPESPGRETREAKKHLQTSSFSLMQMRLRLIGIKKKKGRERTLKDSKKPPPPPLPPFSSLSSSPPRPIIDWLLMCSSSYRVSKRAERVRS